MLLLGLGVTALAALYLIATFFSAPKKCPYPPYGLVGLAVIATAELLLCLDVPPVTVFFTPIVWSGYILAIDAAIFSLRGQSLIRSEPRAFAWMAIFSVFLWLIFELYNLRLKNWTYVGLPPNQYLRYLGYGWSFATILPAILETAEFLLAGRFLPEAASPPSNAYNAGVPQSAAAAPHKPPAGTATGWIVFGLVLVIVPVLVPPDWGACLFGSVWLGFIFLIDPLNQRAGRPSVSGDFRQGYRARLWALMLSGAICGFLWEFWNYWASAKWLYVFPILEGWRIFDMPLPGFFGFPLFAVELFAMYVFAASKLGVPLYETR